LVVEPLGIVKLEAGYAGGDENRWGDVVGLRACVSGVGVAGNRELLYVRGPVLCGFVDMGGSGATLFGGPFSLFEFGLTEASAECLGCTTPPFIDATEFLSEDNFGRPFCEGRLFIPFSIIP